ncbi:MAG TPA: formate/nitrite transporter family protein [Saprospiraceae bacterium]|nr:formate/nitrite transporter family protein [Saprospiraceae bacterium]
MAELFGFEAFSPKEIAERIENTGVTKARLPLLSMIMLGILAGVFIGLGALYFNIVNSDPQLSFGIQRLLGGLVFSLGLILVVVAGAELFTGNNLLVMAWADGKIKLWEVLRNWLVVCFSNFAGALGLAFLVYWSNHPDMNNGEVGLNYVKIATAKCNLSFQHAFFSGMLCNILVCLAVWMAQAGRNIADRVLVILFPISAFVAAGFEHSIANMYLIPMGILLKSHDMSIVGSVELDWINYLQSLIPVILGNLAGGSLFVALIYHIIYRHGAPDKISNPSS